MPFWLKHQGLTHLQMENNFPTHYLLKSISGVETPQQITTRAHLKTEFRFQTLLQQICPQTSTTKHVGQQKGQITTRAHLKTEFRFQTLPQHKFAHKRPQQTCWTTKGQITKIAHLKTEFRFQTLLQQICPQTSTTTHVGQQRAKSQQERM